MNTWIFESSRSTHGACISRSLFGSNTNWPLRVKKGDECFLYNYTERKIYGKWRAECNGALDIEADAWGGRYRFQVRVTKVGATQSFPRHNVSQFICDPNSGFIMNQLDNDRAHNLRQHFSHIEHGVNVLEREFDAIEQDYRRRYPVDYTTQDGHRVRSRSEMIIDDYLYVKGILHAYEPVILCGRQMLIPDFLVRNSKGEDVCIEYWGMLDDEAYLKRMERKKQIYHTHHICLIEVTDDDLKSPDFYVQQKLNEKNI
jgi:hypothetical protein